MRSPLLIFFLNGKFTAIYYKEGNLENQTIASLKILNI